MSTLWQFPSYICAGTLDFLSRCSSLALAQHAARHTAVGETNSITPALLASCSVRFHFTLVLWQTGHYLVPQEQMPGTSHLKNSSNAVCRITRRSRNLICRKTHRERSLHTPRAQTRAPAVGRTVCFQCSSWKPLPRIYQFQLTAPKHILTNTTVKWELIKFCTALVPFCFKI